MYRSSRTSASAYLGGTIKAVVDERDGVRFRRSRRVIADICGELHNDTRPVVLILHSLSIHWNFVPAWISSHILDGSVRRTVWVLTIQPLAALIVERVGEIDHIRGIVHPARGVIGEVLWSTITRPA